MEKVKISKEDIFAGHYVSQTSPKVKKVYRPMNSLWPYVKGILFIGIIVALYLGYGIYRDASLKRMLTEQAPDGTTVNLVKLWDGHKVQVEDEYTRTGRFVTGGYVYFRPGSLKGASLIMKDANNQTICIDAAGITVSVGDELVKIIENKEKNKNKTISVRGYGNTFRPSETDMIIDNQIIKINCDDILKLYVADVKIQ